MRFVSTVFVLCLSLQTIAERPPPTHAPSNGARPRLPSGTNKLSQVSLELVVGEHMIRTMETEMLRYLRSSEGKCFLYHHSVSLFEGDAKNFLRDQKKAARIQDLSGIRELSRQILTLSSGPDGGKAPVLVDIYLPSGRLNRMFRAILDEILFQRASDAATLVYGKQLGWTLAVMAIKQAAKGRASEPTQMGYDKAVRRFSQDLEAALLNEIKGALEELKAEFPRMEVRVHLNPATDYPAHSYGQVTTTPKNGTAQRQRFDLSEFDALTENALHKAVSDQMKLRRRY